jgi:hypothetical protein
MTRVYTLKVQDGLRLPSNKQTDGTGTDFVIQPGTSLNDAPLNMYGAFVRHDHSRYPRRTIIDDQNESTRTSHLRFDRQSEQC